MGHYPGLAVERAMKIQEVILRAASGQIQWWQGRRLSGCLGCSGSSRASGRRTLLPWPAQNRQGRRHEAEKLLEQLVSGHDGILSS